MSSPHYPQRNSSFVGLESQKLVVEEKKNICCRCGCSCEKKKMYCKQCHEDLLIINKK